MHHRFLRTYKSRSTSHNPHPILFLPQHHPRRFTSKQSLNTTQAPGAPLSSHTQHLIVKPTPSTKMSTEDSKVRRTPQSPLTPSRLTRSSPPLHQLLAAILDACEIKLGKPEHDKIAALIGGSECFLCLPFPLFPAHKRRSDVTGNAIRQRIAKIRKNGAAILAAETVGATTTTSGRTNNGASAKKKGRGGGGGSNKRGKVKAEEGGEGDEAPESPSKKVKVDVEELGSFFDDEGGVEGEDAV